MKGFWWLSEEPGPGASALMRSYVTGTPVGPPAVARAHPRMAEIRTAAKASEGRALAADLAAALASESRRLAAAPTTLASIAELARGEAVLVFAGQQPAIGFGPLYGLYKAATAVAVARRLRNGGVPARPAFWVASDDADLVEGGTAYAPGPDRGLVKVTLTNTYEPGTPVGSVPLAECLAAIRTLFPEAPAAMRAHVDAAAEVASDTGDFMAALLLRWFREDGLVVVDSRLPALRRASAPLLARYEAAQEAVGRAVIEAGKWFSDQALSVPIHEDSAISGLFLLDERGRRTKLAPGESVTAHDPERVSAGVLLRPFIQESVFPTAAMVVGPGELAYLTQSDVAAEWLDVQRSPYIARLGMTWVDAALADLAETDEERLALFTDPKPLVERRLLRDMPPAVRDALDRLEANATADLRAVTAAGREADDKGLEQLAEAAARKVRHQIERLRDHALGRARKLASKRGLVLTNVTDVVTPRDRAQERVVSTLWPLLWVEPETFVTDVTNAAEAWLDLAFAGRPAHALACWSESSEPVTRAPWNENYELA